MHTMMERYNDYDLELLDFNYKYREVRNNHLPTPQVRLGGGIYGSYTQISYTNFCTNFPSQGNPLNVAIDGVLADEFQIRFV